MNVCLCKITSLVVNIKSICIKHLRLPRAKPVLTGLTSLAATTSSSAAGAADDVASGAAVVRAPGRERPPIEGREKRSIDKKIIFT